MVFFQTNETTSKTYYKAQNEYITMKKKKMIKVFSHDEEPCHLSTFLSLSSKSSESMVKK